MALRLGDVAPNFSAVTTEGTIDFHQWLGNSWGVLFSHPADYTPVCTTELGSVARTKDEFEKRNVKVIAVSVDPLETHQRWVKDINETQSVTMNFPIIADPDRKVATTYDMIHPNTGDTGTVRSVFVIGPDKKVKLTLTYPDDTGRNFGEILRVIDSLQLTANHQLATPADWQQGQDCIISPAVPDTDAERLFPRGVRKLKPYLRYTPQPTTNPNKALWEKGDFTRIAQSMRESGEALVQSLGVSRGLKVLDLGCGDGTTAIPAARLGAEVLGVDIARNLVEAGNRRAREQNLTNCRFQEGDATNLRELKDQSFDVVVSIFGAMFAPKPFDVAREMVRVTRPGGRIVMGNWIPGDPTLVAQILKISSAYTPPPPQGFISPMTWGVENNVVERFAAAGVPKENISFARDTYTFNFPSTPSELLAAFRKYYGPTMNAFEAAEKNGRAAELQKELEDLFTRENKSPNKNVTSIPATFLRVTVALKDGEAPKSQVQTKPPHAQLIEMATGHWISRIVYVAAKLGLADRLAEGPKSADELAGPTGTHAPSLYRLMRTLAHFGILSEGAGQRFSLTPLGEAMKKNAPGSAYATILTLAGDWCANGFGELLYSVQTGKSGVEKYLGMPVFDWFGQNPEMASLFSQTMVGFHGAESAAVAAAYDFSKMTTIVDVGGATGHLLSTVLSRAPGARGILYDLPHVVRDAPALIQSRGLKDRVTIEAGSFFERVPAGGDAYLLSHIIHDWSEAQCLTILTNCRRAMNPGSRLLLIEMVLPTGNTPHPGKVLDMMMLVGPGGQERTEQEYGKLLAQAGFRLTRLVPTESAVSVVEAEPVVSDTEVERLFPEGAREAKPNLSDMPQPPILANKTQPNGRPGAALLNPSSILQTGFAFWNSKVLLTAVELGVFTKLSGRRLTGGELGAELQFHPRAIADFLDALVAMKFLDRDGNGPQAKYLNTPEGALFLDEASPRYIGGILTMLNARLFKFWNDLPEALRNGRPQNEIKHGQKGMFEELYSDPPRLEQFMGAMTGLSRINFEAFADKFDFSKFRTLCDIGGATGLLSMEVAKKHPHLKCVSFDLPPVEPIAKKHVAAAGLSDRIVTASGDFFKDPLPKADIITMGMILHDWNLEKKMHLIRAAYDALPPGGALVAIEALIDDARRENVQGLLMSLNMLIEFGDAFDYSGADFKKWCGEAGFKRFEVIHLAGPSSAAVAYK
jgi:alkyl hydroperoxide reductase subunit AhpC/2-polyprenyl-3-methyl-5-hydroxy-6-metoxy-1,4-benzoquinol methylase